MARVRVGFVSSLSTEGAETLYRADMVFTREADPVGKHGRASVYCIKGAACMRVLGTGIAIVYGDDEIAMAKMVIGMPDKVVVVVSKKKFKTDSPLGRAAARLERNRRKVEPIIVKAKGDVITAHLTPGASFSIVGRAALLHAHSAPSIPREEKPAAKTVAPSTPKKDTGPAPSTVAPSVPKKPAPPVAVAVAPSAPKKPAPVAKEAPARVVAGAPGTDTPKVPKAPQPAPAPKAKPAPEAKPAEPVVGSSER